MLTKQTILNQIEITESGVIQLRFAFKVLDGTEELSSAWHRTAIEPGVVIDLVISSLNQTFAAMNKEPIGQSDIDKLKTISSSLWTPDFIIAYKAKQDASQNQTVV